MLKLGQILVCRQKEYDFMGRFLVVEMRHSNYHLINVPEGISMAFWEKGKRTLEELEQMIYDEGFEILEVKEMGEFIKK